MPEESQRMPMSVVDIVRQYLMLNDYDGLCEPEMECGCGLDDLAPCGDLKADCKSAYRIPDKTGETDFIFSISKEVKSDEEVKEEGM